MPHKPIRPKEIIKQRNRRLIAVTLAALLFFISYFAYWRYAERDWVSTDDAFVAGHLITVKAQTEGTVVEILAENTQTVEQGQLLISLDGVRAEIDLQHAEAALAETVRNIVALKASVGAFNGRILAKQAELSQLLHDLRRFKGALKDGAVSAQQIENATDKIAELKAAISALQNEKSGVEARVQGVAIESHPSVEKAKNAVRLAFLAYQRRHILAPVSGFVAKRRVQVGDSVKEGTPLLVIVPLNDLWIEANFLESQIENIRPGQTAEVKADLHGEDVIYHGRVQGIQPGTGSSFALFPADNSTGNFIHIAERVPVRIGLDAKELNAHPLRPGLSTLTRINAAQTGLPVLTSTVDLKASPYRTAIYNGELKPVEEIINGIIRRNIIH